MAAAHAGIAVFNQRLVPCDAVFFQRPPVAQQTRLAGGRGERHRNAGDLPVPLCNQIFHRLKGRVLLFEKDAALARLADVAVDYHQRHGGVIDKLHNRGFAHMAGVEDDSVALPVRQHLHGFQLAGGRVVAVGDDKLLAMRLGLARRLLQQTPEVKAVKARYHQANAVTGAVRQRSGQQVRAVSQFFHCPKNLRAGTLFDLARVIQHA